MLRVVLAAVVLLGACVRPPVQLAGEFPPTSIAEARGDGHEGERVRWGGIIVTATPEKSATCFELVVLSLDRRARPRETDATPGRFVACAPGFFDPAIYAPKREVTVVGTIDGITSGKVGEYDYVFPRLVAEVVYLWPERPMEQRVYYYGGPYWYPYQWGWYAPPPRVRR